MTLPASGPISASQINTELSKSATATISLGDAAVRSLAGKASGSISFADLLGKAAWTPTLSPPSGNSSGLTIYKEFSITCNGAPEGATYSWTVSYFVGRGAIISNGSTAKTATLRVETNLGETIEARVTCTVTHNGVSKSVSSLSFLYTQTTNTGGQPNT